MSKIDTKDLYQEIARHIPEWPTNADVFYLNWNSWYCLLGKEKLSLSATLINEWHPTKNGELTPQDVSGGSGKKVWWKCKKGHEWQATLGSRSGGCGCPYCSGRKADKENCLAVINPQLAKEWHPTKNGELTAKDVKPHSSKKAWWKCKKGHEWEASLDNRSDHGCPYCSGNRVTPEKSVARTKPNLMKEWHPTKNGNLTPEDVSYGSEKKAWWKCKKGHEWQAVINSRVRGNGCPYCSGKRSDKDNCLSIVRPQLVKEWHSIKNGKLTPNDVTKCSNRKVWWKCKKGHEWATIIRHRSNGSGCPVCSGRQVDAYNALATVNPQLAKEWHPTQNGELTAKDVKPHSSKKVWWKCKNGHEWQAVISYRSKGYGCCPHCYRLRRA